MDANDSTDTALAHLAMLAFAANGEYSPKPGEVDKRQAAIVSYIRTGQCVADEADQRLIAAVREAVKEVAL